VATAVWDGHVFINLSERPKPFSEHLAALPAKFAPWGWPTSVSWSGASTS
jgi:phenylpropionate dioxygenase-like ring-hydroxylating dioxygenase large terminal subunit